MEVENEKHTFKKSVNKISEDYQRFIGFKKNHFFSCNFSTGSFDNNHISCHDEAFRPI